VSVCLSEALIRSRMKVFVSVYECVPIRSTHTQPYEGVCGCVSVYLSEAPIRSRMKVGVGV